MIKVRFVKIVVFLLVFGLIVTPSTAKTFAFMINSLKKPVIIDYESNHKVEKVELTHLRKSNLKVFLKENNQLEYVYYDKDIHFFNGNFYEEYIMEVEEFENYYLTTNQLYNIQYPKDISNGSFIMNSSSYTIEWDYINVKGNIELDDKIIYKDVFTNFDNINLQLFHGNNTFKENVILSNYNEDFEYSFILNTNGLNLVNENNIYYLKDDQNNIIFMLDNLFMVDSANNYSYDLSVTCQNIENNQYLFNVIPSDDWLKNANYPVIIDPIIEKVTDQYSLNLRTKTYIKSIQSTEALNNGFYVGSDGTSINDIICIVELEKPIINVDTSNAKVTFMNKEFEGINIFEIYKYNTNLTYEDIHSINYNSINKSLIARKFYSTKEIELPYNSIFDENDKSILLLNPCGSGYIYLRRMNDEPHPVVKITNVINKNINFNNDCIDLEKAGSASININTGNLIYQYYDSKYLADYSLFNIQHIYSGNFVNESFTPYGKGFKSIYNEIIYKEGINYIYQMADGTEITFVNSSLMEGEYNNTNLYISVDSNNYKLIIEDNDKYLLYCEDIREFEVKDDSSNVGYLTKIMQSRYVDRAVNISYDKINNNYIINEVIDSYGNKVVFNYDNVLLTELQFYNMIFDEENNDEEIGLELYYKNLYTYNTDNLLTEIKTTFNNTVNDTSVKIEYIDNLISKVCYGNNEVCEIGKEFIYDESKRVTAYKNYKNDNTIFNSIKEYYYYENKTMIKDSTGYVERFWFDIYGNIIKNDNSNLMIYNYYYDNSPLNQHNLIDSISSCFSGINYLQDNLFISNDYWQENINNNGIITKLNSEYIEGANQIKITRTADEGILTFNENLVLKEGTYVLSAMIKNDGINGVSLLDIVSSNVENDNDIVIISRSSEVSNTGNFYKNYYIQFEIKEMMEVNIALVNNSIGSSYFDSVSINNVIGNRDYNLIRNSSFELVNMGEWNDIYIDSNNYTAFPPSYGTNFGDKCGLIFMYENEEQIINTSGNGNDEFLLTLWYTMLYDSSIVENGYLSVSIIFNCEDGTKEEFTIESKECKEFSTENFKIDNLVYKVIPTKDYLSATLKFSTYGIECVKVDNIELIKQSINNEEIVAANDESSEDDKVDITIGLPDEISAENRYQVYDIYDSYNLLSNEEKQIYSETSIIKLNELLQSANEFNGEPLPKNFLNDEYIYGYNYQYIVKILNDAEIEAQYAYDTLKGKVTNVTSADNKVIKYTYDSIGRLSSIIEDISNTENDRDVTYTYDNFDRIIKVTTSSGTIEFFYNSFGNISYININEVNLLTLEYLEKENIETNIIEKYVYNNGYIVEHIYNDNTQLTQIKYSYNGEIINYYNMSYDLLGNLIKVNNSEFEMNYEYDQNNCLVKTTNSLGVIISYDSNLKQTNFKYNNFNIIENYVSNEENVRKNYSGIEYYIETDSEASLIENIFFNDLYLVRKTNFTEQEISSIEYLNEKIEYSFENNCVKTMTHYYYENEVLVNKIKYEYIFNESEQLVKYSISELSEDIEFTLNDVILECYYEYDIMGNIVSIERPIKLEKYSTLEGYIEYTYNSNFKDLLLSKTIKSDKNGNIISIYSYEYDNFYNMTKEYLNGILINEYTYDGRELTGYIDYINNKYIEYKYDYSGIRYEKNIYQRNETSDLLLETHQYVTMDSRIISEIIKYYQNNIFTHEDILYFYYNDNEELLGFKYLNGLTDVENNYFYQLNLLNDIIGIYNQNMEKIVSYEYDAYGNIIEINSDEIISNINPFRYRGYYFDNESSKYYLNTRYYDASLYRFLTLDDFGYLGSTDRILSYNLYNYCENNPIKYFDKFGTEAILIIDFGEIGLKVFGHALLIINYDDTNYLIEIGKKDFLTEEYKVSNSGPDKERIDLFLHAKDGESHILARYGLNGFLKLTINGDFTNAYNFANKYKGTYELGRYNLFTNNCLHFVKKVLLSEKSLPNHLLNFLKSNTQIIPVLFYYELFNYLESVERSKVEYSYIQYLKKNKLNDKFKPIILREEIVS